MHRYSHLVKNSVNNTNKDSVNNRQVQIKIKIGLTIHRYSHLVKNSVNNTNKDNVNNRQVQ